jgi:phosphate transport system protein
MTRDKYHHELDAVQTDVTRMAAMASDSIRRALEALRGRDPETAGRVVEDDDRIDALHLELEERCMRLLALQQPMARDLRTIAAVFAITIDLERMADHGEGIGRAVRRLAAYPPVEPPGEIWEMGTLVSEMARNAVDALLTQNAEQARTLAAKDDAVDALRSRAFQQLLGRMIADPTSTPLELEMLLVVQHLERAADHLTNVAERVIYLLTGELRELNT